jgi:phage baseplate assembly protein W
MSAYNIDFPYQIGGRGRTATVDEDAHILDMLEQLLFTNPGERVNRPNFGSGVLQLIFAPNSPELAGTLQFTLKAAILHWLGDLVEVQELEVTSDDATLSVDLQYVVKRTGATRTAQLTRPV